MRGKKQANKKKIPSNIESVKVKARADRQTTGALFHAGKTPHRMLIQLDREGYSLPFRAYSSTQVQSAVNKHHVDEQNSLAALQSDSC